MKFRAVYAFLCVFWVSCASRQSAQERLLPPRSTIEVRLSDIEAEIAENPSRAVHLAGVYRAIYGVDDKLDSFLQEAVISLKTQESAAYNEKRYDDAASLARSLRALSISAEDTRGEDDFLLAEAKESLAKGDNLAAFLAAFAANRVAPLSAEDALPFFERAIEVKERGSAAFFMSIIDKNASAAKSFITEEKRAFAAGSDSTAVMVKGVATVLVDRGLKAERGVTYPDRVLGSAFFVDASGLLITNYHVIESEVSPTYEGYSRLYIRQGGASSARVPAKVIGYDKVLDLALIKAEVKPEYVFSLMDRTEPQVGEAVLAIGSPGGLEKTVTRGIVSALGRRFLQLGDVIQIDAAVNHGNSGGPVLDTAGRLVGIVFAGALDYEGLNFAVPAERLASALPAMLKGGKAERPWLGLTLAETREGAEIIYVSPLTPAQEQRMSAGEVLTKLNGSPVTAPTGAPEGSLITAWQDALFASRKGELCTIETAGGNKYSLALAARPDIPLAEAAKIDTKERIAAPLFGIVLAPSVGGARASTYLVEKVIRGSIADEFGISAQDPVSIRSLKVESKEGYATMDIAVKTKNKGYFENLIRFSVSLDSSDTL